MACAVNEAVTQLPNQRTSKSQEDTVSDFPESPYEAQPSPEEPKKSGSGLKIFLWIIGIGGGLLLLACGGCIIGSIIFARSAMTTDPPKVREMAQSITEIEPPAGYDPVMGMNAYVFKMVVFGEEGQESGRMLVLMSFQADMGDQADMERQMNQSLQQQGQQQLEQIESETRPYTIRGEEVQVRIARVKTEDGVELRQATAVFTSKEGGPAMLMLMMPEEEWSNGGEEEFEAMLQSMK
jgi:hypothetical protein